jgi:hypothetical protein
MNSFKKVSKRYSCFWGKGICHHENVIMQSSGPSAIKISDDFISADAMLIIIAAINVYPSRIKDRLFGVSRCDLFNL